MKKKQTFLLSFIVLLITASCTTKGTREVLNLNGEWQIAKTSGNLPDSYVSTIPVPGLVDLAQPLLDTLGTLYGDGWYWHKRTFTISNKEYDKMILKIHKAKYYTKVYLNGKYVGENPYCFTPSYFDLKPYLIPGKKNEIIIGIGCKNNLPDTIPDGHDYEKLKYIPGIYDNVEIICANTPYINNIQCVPDVVGEKVRVVAELETGAKHNTEIKYIVRELVSGKEVASKSVLPEWKEGTDGYEVDFSINMPGAKLWSPESPFLYELELNTGGDIKKVRFGMRSFRFDPEKKIALLNEKPYYLRGTNICIFRFFEDPDRNTLPWNEEWPEKLHKKFKDMKWNSMRYCIGFPPERWYDICDSLGIMLQDEYPLWYLKPTVRSKDLAEEYKRWMRERWNHPSVVIWDAQNELVTTETGPALHAVRNLDLSDRPWENGWSIPDRPTDAVEAHPYAFSKYQRGGVQPPEGYKKEIFSKPARPWNDANTALGKYPPIYMNAMIINEYGWLWLNRDGSPTTLTDILYNVLWNGKDLTAQERLEIYARHLAMLTEYWRAHRQVAGVLHFCGLGYSRPTPPRGETSDHWVDINNLVYEPTYYKYVKPAFSPVGLMVDTWEKSYTPGATYQIPVYVINDLGEDMEKKVQVRLLSDGNVVQEYEQIVQLKPFEVAVTSFDIVLPKTPGMYYLKGELEYDNEKVFSLRDIPVKQ